MLLSVGLIVGQWVVSADARHDSQTRADLRKINDQIVRTHDQEGELITDIDKIIRLVADEGISARSSERGYELEFVKSSEEPIFEGLLRPPSSRSMNDSWYRICATFLTDTSSDSFSEDSVSYDFTEHKQGRSCFLRHLSTY